MDLWSRLIGGAGSSPARTKIVPTNTPTERIAACKGLCNALQKIWRSAVPLPTEKAAAQTADCIGLLNNLIEDESKKAAPYPCLWYTASTQIYIIVSKLTVTFEDDAVALQTTKFFHILVNADAEGLLDTKIFARSLVDFVRRTTGNNVLFATGELDQESARQSEADRIGLLFAVATKLRLDPDILPAWFYPERDLVGGEPNTRRAAFAGTTRKNAFPLLYLLIDFVHHDGPTGDFARTGLLYLVEIASKVPPLEKWMIESDLPTIMASGLGALYSRLTRSLPLMARNQKLPTILAMSDFTPSPAQLDRSDDFVANLDMFLSFLMFWQDTLNHCYSKELADTLLDHFQVIFLQQLLYPSLLESSDAEGGSTASVIMYLCTILQSLHHRSLVECILRYLLMQSREPPRSGSPHRRIPRMSLSRRKSLENLAILAESQENPSPTLFNLLDLMMMGLKSTRAQTVTSTLTLVTVILQHHHDIVMTSLFRLGDLPTDLSKQTVSLLNGRVTQLFAFATTIIADENIDEAYNHVLQDISALLESHPCSHIRVPSNKASIRYVIASYCPLMTRMHRLLVTFFANQTTTNLALTETIVSLACCKMVVLDGWLFPQATTTTQPISDDGSVLQIIDSLIEQVQQWQATVPEWQSLIARQKEKLGSEAGEAAEDSTIDQFPMSLDSRESILKSSSIVSRQSADQRPTTPIGRSLPTNSARASAVSSPNLAGTPVPAAKLGSSPLRLILSRPGSSRDASATHSVAWELLQLQLSLPLEPRAGMGAKDTAVTGLGSGRASPLNAAADDEEEDEEEEDVPTASLNHILTNAVILQEFILELAAVLQIRASMFLEVEFD